MTAPSETPETLSSETGPLALSRSDVAAVAQRIAPYVRVTPVVRVDRADFGLPAGPLTFTSVFMGGTLIAPTAVTVTGNLFWY